MVWIACLVALIVVTAVLVLAPWRVHVTLQARGEPNGAWAIACGGQMGPVAASAAAARDVTPTVQVHVFHRRLWQRELRGLFAKKKKPREPEGEGRGLLDRYEGFERWFDPADVATFLAGEHRRVRLERLRVDLDYSFEDVATTGKMMGAVYALDGMLPPRIALRQQVSWDAIDRGALALSATIKFWPGLLATDSLWFGLRRVKLIRRRPAVAGASKTS